MKRYYKAFVMLLVGFLFIMPLFQEPGLSPVLNRSQNNQDQIAVTSQGPRTPQLEWSYTTDYWVHSSPSEST